MQNNELKNCTEMRLPVLKPMRLAPNFVEKIKGDKLHSDVMMLVAEDEDFVFFVSCLNEFENVKTNPDILKIYENEGINEKGEAKEITIAKAVDLSTIFKINYFELKSKIVNEDNEVEKLPYLGIRNQLEVVNRITEKLNSNDDQPRLVIVRKRVKEQAVQNSMQLV